MANQNTKFKITDERLEWDQDEPWSSSESSGEPSDVRSETVESSERKRTVMIAAEGAAAGGLLVGFVMTLLMLSSSSGSSSATTVARAKPTSPEPVARVVNPAAKKLAHQKVTRAVEHGIGDAHKVVMPPAREHTAVNHPHRKHRTKAHRKHHTGAHRKHHIKAQRKHTARSTHRHHRNSK